MAAILSGQRKPVDAAPGVFGLLLFAPRSVAARYDRRLLGILGFGFACPTPPRTSLVNTG